jgi:uncharacterized protein YodC (DUF2158 family)
MNEGSIVRLKSGGPLMTVGEIKDGVYYCVWMDIENKFQSANFFGCTLKLEFGI